MPNETKAPLLCDSVAIQEKRCQPCHSERSDGILALYATNVEMPSSLRSSK
jgi:hypothetical protein